MRQIYDPLPRILLRLAVKVGAGLQKIVEFSMHLYSEAPGVRDQ